MLNEVSIVCPIWQETVPKIQRVEVSGNLPFLRSPRTGGDFRIMFDAQASVRALNVKQKAKLTTMLIELRRAGEPVPLVTADLVEQATIADPLPVHERAERLLRYLTKKTQSVGEDLYSGDIMNDLEAHAWSESVTPYELEFFINYFVKMEWLKPSGSGMFIITVSGYEHVAEQARKTDSSQCFVGMWFNDSMNEAYEGGIKKAIEECGYMPMRIDQKQHLNKICDEAIAEIRRSRFVVADLTHGADGARGSVYYEAGFAHALGLPVIFSCRKDHEKQLHFDTRQYPHILWEKPEDLYAELRNKIGALIGDYKAESAPAVSE